MLVSSTESFKIDLKSILKTKASFEYYNTTTARPLATSSTGLLNLNGHICRYHPALICFLCCMASFTILPPPLLFPFPPLVPPSILFVLVCSSFSRVNSISSHSPAVTQTFYVPPGFGDNTHQEISSALCLQCKHRASVLLAKKLFTWMHRAVKTTLV